MKCRHIGYQMKRDLILRRISGLLEPVLMLKRKQCQARISVRNLMVILLLHLYSITIPFQQLISLSFHFICTDFIAFSLTSNFKPRCKLNLPFEPGKGTVSCSVDVIQPASRNSFRAVKIDGEIQQARYWLPWQQCSFNMVTVRISSRVYRHGDLSLVQSAKDHPVNRL